MAITTSASTDAAGNKRIAQPFRRDAQQQITSQRATHKERREEAQRRPDAIQSVLYRYIYRRVPSSRRRRRPSTIVIISQSVRSAGGNFQYRQQPANPADRKKHRAAGEHLLSAEAPRLKRVKRARIGEPDAAHRAIKPIPISTHRPNATGDHPLCCVSARRSPASSAPEQNNKPPAALTKDREDHQRPFMPSTSHLIPPFGLAR